MEGVEFQIRSHENHPPAQYPLSFDQRLLQGDAFRKAKERLESRMVSLEQIYSKQEGGSHSGQPTNCNRCLVRKRQIRQAFSEYYLSAEPERWDSGHYQYQEEIQRMLKDEEKYSLQDIYNFHIKTLRAHLQADFAASLPCDTKESIAFRDEYLNYLWDKEVPLKDMVSFYNKTQHSVHESPDTAEFIEDLQRTTTSEQRAQLYIKYYCAIKSTDSPALKNFKSKYARQFAELQSHDTVLSAMQEESDCSQAKSLDKLKAELNELQLAKSATMKHKKRRAEQADQRMLDRDVEGSRRVSCGRPGCRTDVDLSEETIECVICDWLVRNGANKRRVYYCSVEHADEDFDEHDLNDHRCCMGSRCFFHPQPGPPGSTGAGGFCRDCTDHKVSSYFCSQQCFQYNLDFHRNEIHYAKEIESSYDRLEGFRPADDFLEIIS